MLSPKWFSPVFVKTFHLKKFFTCGIISSFGIIFSCGIIFILLLLEDGLEHYKEPLQNKLPRLFLRCRLLHPSLLLLHPSLSLSVKTIRTERNPNPDKVFFINKYNYSQTLRPCVQTQAFRVQSTHPAPAFFHITRL